MLAEVDFADFQRNHKQQTVQQMQYIMVIQRQIAELREKYMDSQNLSLTRGGRDDIMNQDKLEFSSELLGAVVSRCGDMNRLEI